MDQLNWCKLSNIFTQAIYKTFNDLTSDYNRAVRPQFFGKETNVGIELYLIGVPNVDTKSMELDLDMYFRQVLLYVQTHIYDKHNIYIMT